MDSEEFTECRILFGHYDYKGEHDLGGNHTFVYKMTLKSLDKDSEVNTAISMLADKKLMKWAEMNRILVVAHDNTYFHSSNEVKEMLDQAGMLYLTKISLQYSPVLFKINCNAILPYVDSSVLRDIFIYLTCIRPIPGSNGIKVNDVIKSLTNKEEIESVYGTNISAEMMSQYKKLVDSIENSIDPSLRNMDFKDLLCRTFTNKSVILQDRGGIPTTSFFQHDRKMDDSAFVSFIYGQIALYYAYSARMQTPMKLSLIMKYSKPMIYKFEKGVYLRFTGFPMNFIFFPVDAKKVITQDKSTENKKGIAWSPNGMSNIRLPPLEKLDDKQKAYDLVNYILTENKEVTYEDIINLMIERFMSDYVVSKQDFNKRSKDIMYQSLGKMGNLSQEESILIGESVFGKAKRAAQAVAKTGKERIRRDKQRDKKSVVQSFRDNVSVIERDRLIKIGDPSSKFIKPTARQNILNEYITEVLRTKPTWQDHMVGNDVTKTYLEGKQKELVKKVNTSLCSILYKIKCTGESTDPYPKDPTQDITNYMKNKAIVLKFDWEGKGITNGIDFEAIKPKPDGGSKRAAYGVFKLTFAYIPASCPPDPLTKKCERVRFSPGLNLDMFINFKNPAHSSIYRKILKKYF